MTNPRVSQKFLALVSVMPVLADFMEDLKDTNIFDHSVWQKCNMAVKAIRQADKKLFDRIGFTDMTDEEFENHKRSMSDQQAAMSIAFRQFVTNEYIEHSDAEDNSEEQEAEESNSEG